MKHAACLFLAAAALAGCADTGYVASYNAPPYTSYDYGYGYNAWDSPILYGPVATAPVFIDGRFHHGFRNRDFDHDGIPNRFDRDRDGDGVPNRFDRHPNDPRRR
jgi:hypothetical protein